jgi:hypothetical protein
MRRVFARGALLAAVAVLWAPASASAQSTLPPRTEIEPNNSLATPDPVPVLTDTAIRGSISAPGDLDFFRVVVSQQASVRFQTWVPDRPQCARVPPFSADTVLRLFNGAGQLIGADDDSGLDLCDLLVRDLAPGTYFISVEESFRDGIIPAYTLEIDFTPDQVPPQPPGEDDDEDEDEDDDGEDDDEDEDEDDDGEDEDDDDGREDD